MNVQTVTVVGVTGTMGANVAGIFASFGDAKVYCVGRDIENSEEDNSAHCEVCQGGCYSKESDSS